MNTIRLLMIEDNPADQRLIYEMLRECTDPSFSLVGAGRLEDGLRELGRGPFDVILLDLGLPDSQEFEGLQRISWQYPRIPIIVLTGADDETIGLQGIQRHAADYLVKGKIDLSLLTRSIRYAIERKQQEQTLQKSHQDLELKVRERTSDLLKANKDLKLEIAERRRLAAEMETYQARLRALAEKLSSTEERERRRISAQIHDTVIQTLSLSNIKLGVLRKELAAEGSKSIIEQVNAIRAIIEDAIRESRSLMAELTPPLLYELGLMSAINNLAHLLQQKHEITIRVQDDAQPKPVNKVILGILFQATRELILNALKHAGKCSVTVAISRENDQLRISVEDNGSGFEVPETGRFIFHSDGGFGLFAIRERLEGIGGRMVISSKVGAGTRVLLYVPLEA